ncbi:MAG: hypothetical protein IPP78_15365 [Holophagaceae bacterium]|nr:hypothetical protein [Holophagaceae bacterium]
MALTQGIRLGPYKLLSPLGAGGVGEMYKASRDGRTVALTSGGLDVSGLLILEGLK